MVRAGSPRVIVGDFLTTGDPAALRVVHVCYTDAKGGAAIGAHRLHSAMRASGVDSSLAVVLKFTHDERVIPIPNGKWRHAGIRYFNQELRSLHASGNPVIRSINVIPTKPEERRVGKEGVSKSRY